MVEVLSKDLLKITRFDQDSFVTIEDTECIKALLIGTVALVPAHIDDLLEEVVLKATSLVVLAV